MGNDLLVAAPERWDEACFAVPALRAAMATGIGLGVICREEQHQFWQSLAGLQVFSFPEKTKAKALAATIRGSWQAALLWDAGLAAEAVHLAGVPQRLGPRTPRALQKRLTQPLGFTEQPMDHRVRYYLSAMEEMGIPTRNPEFFAPANLLIPPMPHTVLFSPDSDFGPSHEWPLDRWLEIASRIRHSHHRVAVAIFDGGRSLGKSLAAQLGDDVERLPVPTFATALPMLASFSRVIAADGSLPHLAAHVGATCVTLFGPNDPVWKRPLGRRHSLVCRHAECAPCLLAKCPLDLRCQSELETERVWASLEKTLG